MKTKRETYRHVARLLTAELYELRTYDHRGLTARRAGPHADLPVPSADVLAELERIRDAMEAAGAVQDSDGREAAAGGTSNGLTR